MAVHDWRGHTCPQRTDLVRDVTHKVADTGLPREREAGGYGYGDRRVQVCTERRSANQIVAGGTNTIDLNRRRRRTWRGSRGQRPYQGKWRDGDAAWLSQFAGCRECVSAGDVASCGELAAVRN
jgi:hypothetical protein